MADQDAKALLLTIQANTELLRSNLSAAERAVEEFTSKTQSHLDEQDKKFELFGKGLEKLEGPLERLKALTEVAVGAVLGESLLEAGKKGLEFAGNVKFVSEQVGTSTDFLQKFRFAASQFGVATATADEGLNKFGRSIGEAANGNKTLVDLFDRLGVSVFDSGGKVRSVESVYMDTANAIKALDSPAQKSADTLELMGKGASELIPLLSDGAGGFRQLAAAAEQLGIVLNPELIEHSEEVNHKLSALKEIVDAEMAATIAQNAHAIEGFASAVVKLGGAFARFLESHPHEAMMMLGASAGFLKGGPEGAIVGAGVGVVAGEYLKGEQEDDTADISKREAALRAAARRVRGDELANNGMKGWEGDKVTRQGWSTDDLPEAKAEFQRQRGLYMQSFRETRARQADDELGSNRAGVTNDNGDALKKAQEELGHLEAAKAHASGAALAAYNDEIKAKQRQIAFIKQGADADMASSLASKQSSIEHEGETRARAAARKAEEVARKAEELRQKNLEADISFAGEQQKLRRQILDGMGKSAANDNLRDQLQREEINAEADTLRKQYQARYDKGDMGSDPKVAQARLEALIGTKDKPGGLVENVRDQKLGNVTTARLSQTLQDQLDAANLDLQGKITMAGLQERLATTAKQRLKIDLQLLDYQEQMARQAAQRVIDDTSGKYSDQDKLNAQTQLVQIGAQHALAAQGLQRQDASPLQSYRNQLLGSTDLSDGLQGAGVDGIKGIEDGLIGISTQAETAKQALHGIFLTLLTDLEKLALEKGILALLGGSSGGSGGGSGLGGLFGGLLGHLFGGGGSSDTTDAGGWGFGSGGGGFDDEAAYANGGLPGFADGGDPTVDGGIIRGAGTGRSDSILALLGGRKPIRVSNGEGIVNEQAVKRWWPEIDAMNKGTFGKFADGGLVSPDTMIAPRIPDMREIAASRAVAQQQAIRVALDIAPSELFDVKARQNAHDVVDERKQELVASSVSATADASKRRLISMSSR